MDNYSFRHLDPSVTPTYRSTVLYGFSNPIICYMLKVKNGYVIESPFREVDKWIRGQHIDALRKYFDVIKPIRILSDAY